MDSFSPCQLRPRPSADCFGLVARESSDRGETLAVADAFFGSSYLESLLRFGYRLPHGEPVTTEEDDQFEPMTEPSADAIAWEELLFWLGDDNSGRVECSCRTCILNNVELAERQNTHVGNPVECEQYRYLRIPMFNSRLSPLIPVISLPRIDAMPPRRANDEW